MTKGMEVNVEYRMRDGGNITFYKINPADPNLGRDREWKTTRWGTSLDGWCWAVDGPYRGMRFSGTPGVSGNDLTDLIDWLVLEEIAQLDLFDGDGL